MKHFTDLLRILKSFIYAFFILLFISCNSAVQSDIEEDTPADDTEVVDDTE